MKQVVKGWTGCALLVALVAVGCKVEVGEGDDERESQSDAGAPPAAVAGSSTGAGGSSDAASDDGGAGSGTIEDGGASAGGAAGSEMTGTSLVEDCDTDVEGTNDDTEHAVALGSGATLCLQGAGDLDFVYIDAPAGKKASIARVLIAPDPGVSADFKALADADGSTLGSAYTSGGADVNLALVLAPGSRTYLSFKPFVTGGVVVLTSKLETEQDDFEPNNEKSQAASIAVNTDVVAQFHGAYASSTDQSGVDWYRATLAAGPHTLRLAHVPDDLRLEVRAYDPKGAGLGSKYAGSSGQSFDYEFMAATAGEYRFELGFFVGGPPVFVTGKEPASIADTYTFRIDE